MSGLAIVLFLVWALRCCSMTDSYVCEIDKLEFEIDRRVCALPLHYCINDSHSENACVTSEKLYVEGSLEYIARAMRRERFTGVLLPFWNYIDRREFATNITESFNETTRVYQFSMQWSADSILNKYEVRPPVRLIMLMELALFRHQKHYFNLDYYLQCIARFNRPLDSMDMSIKYDIAPTVRFEVLSETFSVIRNASLAADAPDLSETPNSTLTILIDKIDSKVVANVHVVDPDVFESNSDPLEYSAISKLNVTLSATVHFADDSQHQIIPLLLAASGNCEQVDWCKKESTSLSVRTNEARVQYQLFIANLTAAVKALHGRSRHGRLSSARVVVTIEASVASGCYEEPSSKTLTLDVVIPQSLLSLQVASSPPCFRRVCKPTPCILTITCNGKRRTCEAKCRRRVCQNVPCYP